MQFVCDSMLELFSIVSNGNGNGDDDVVDIVVAIVVVSGGGDVPVAKQTIFY